MVEEEAEATITILIEAEMVDILTEEPQQIDQTLTALEIILEYKITELDLRLTRETQQEKTHLEHQEIIIILHQEIIVLHQEPITIQPPESIITIQLQEVHQEVVLEVAHQGAEVVLEVEDLEVVEVN